MEDVTLRLGGLAQNLDDPARRNVTVNVEGLATGVWAADPEVAAGARHPHRPLRRRGAAARRRRSGCASCSSAATACRSSPPARSTTCVYTGRSAVRVADLAIFAGLAERPLAGAVDLRADGSVTPLSGGFDLTFDGSATDLALGDAAARPRCSPARPRSPAGRSATRPASAPRTCGSRTRSSASPRTAASPARRTDIGFDASLSDLALLDPRAQRRGDRHRPRLAARAGRSPSSCRRRDPRGQADRHAASTGARDRLRRRASTAPTSPAALTAAAALDGLVLDLAGDVAVAGERPLAPRARRRGRAEPADRRRRRSPGSAPVDRPARARRTRHRARSPRSRWSRRPARSMPTSRSTRPRSARASR